MNKRTFIITLYALTIGAVFMVGRHSDWLGPLASPLSCTFGAQKDEKQADSSYTFTRDLGSKRRTALIYAAEHVAPSVVSIGAERVAYVQRRGADDWFPFFGGTPFYEKALRKTPYIGSGIAIDKEGHIVTNHHVIEGANKVFVTLPNGEEHEAKVLDSDPIRDIAILKIDAPNIQPAVLGDSDDVRLGEWALAVGNPFGTLIADPSPTITAGVISATNRFFRSSGDPPRIYEGMIQTDAAINPGNSGGALANAAGEVIGINTFIFSESGGSIGLGFAIPINRVKSMVEEIRKYGRLRQVKLDFEPIDLTPRVRRVLQVPGDVQGVLIYQMERNGPADRAGLEPGDIILSVDEQRVKTRRDFLVQFYGADIGEALKLEIQRNGKRMNIEYTVEERRSNSV